MRLAALLLAVALLPALAPAQAPTPLERRADSVFAAFSRTNTPGCAVGVDRDGTPLLRRAWGMASLETPVPFTVNTISESGSTAKQFVAAAMVLLARDGVLSLDDDITKWLPEARGFNRRITIRHLLSHTSGIPDRYTLHDAENRPAGEVDHPNAEVLDLVSRLRELNFDPGEDYLYSNTGYILAAAIVERASKSTLQQFTQARIFGPLGMTNTRWREDHRVVVPGRAAAYAGSANAGWRNDHPFTRVIGSGGLNITIDDYLKWTGAQQRRTGVWGDVGDSLSQVIRLNDGTAITYGLGVSTDTWRGVRRISHTGSTGGYRAALYQFPQQKIAIALLCNSGAANPGGLATSMAVVVLGDALGPVAAEAMPAIAITGEALAALAGRYRSPRTEEVMLLQVRDGNLVDSLGLGTFSVAGADRFRMRGGTAELRFANTAAGRTVTWVQPNTRAVEFKLEEAPLTGAAAVAAYAGTFQSPELADARYTLVARGDTLMLDQGWRGTTILRPILRDEYALPDGTLLHFLRDPRGRVSGFTVWAGRVRHLRFDRLPTGSR